MNSAHDVLPEDRAEFERVLDEALRSARLGNGAGGTDAVRRVRRAALEARPQLTAAAGDEYHRYVRLREQLRAGAGQPDGRERSGGGNLAVVSVLIPVLAGIAAVVFLLVGYVMGLSDNEAGVARSMRDIGWLFALFAAFGLLLAVAGLVITAARNGSASAIRAGEQDAGRGRLAGDVAEAREDWRRALVERGIAPYLRQAVALHASGGDGDRDRDRDRDGGGEARGTASGRVAPQRRFSSPEFSSPTGGAPRTTPRVGHPEYSRPEFSSPEFSTQRGEEPAPAKGYAAPDYASPERSGGASRGYSTGRYTAGDFAAGDYTSGDYARPGFDSSSSSGGEGEGEDRGGERPAKGYAAPDFGSPDYAGPRRKDDAAGPAGGEENRP